MTNEHCPFGYTNNYGFLEYDDCGMSLKVRRFISILGLIGPLLSVVAIIITLAKSIRVFNIAFQLYVAVFITYLNVIFFLTIVSLDISVMDSKYALFSYSISFPLTLRNNYLRLRFFVSYGKEITNEQNSISFSLEVLKLIAIGNCVLNFILLIMYAGFHERQIKLLFLRIHYTYAWLAILLMGLYSFLVVRKIQKILKPKVEYKAVNMLQHHLIDNLIQLVNMPQHLNPLIIGLNFIIVPIVAIYFERYIMFHWIIFYGIVLPLRTSFFVCGQGKTRVARISVLEQKARISRTQENSILPSRCLSDFEIVMGIKFPEK